MDPTLDSGLLYEIVTQRQERFRRQAKEHTRSTRRREVPSEPSSRSTRR